MELKKYRLGDIADIGLSGVDKKTKPNEKKVSLCNFVDVYYNWAITKSMEPDFMIATANENEIQKFTLHKGQVALTKDSETRDDIGISTYIADDFENTILGYHTALVTPHVGKLDGKYLNAYLHTKMAQKYFSDNATGSGQRYSLSVDTLNDFQIYLPTYEEQKKVGKIFSLIDRKIALNRETNKNLETIAKQLYDYWFVQFDFPDENGKPYKTNGGEMVWNKLMKKNIPNKWETKPLGDLIDKVSSGFRPGAIDKNLKEGLPSIGAECIDELGVFDFCSTPYVEEKNRKLMTSGKIENRDILIYKDGAYVGKTTFFQDGFPFKEAFVNEHVFLVHCKNEDLQEFLYFTLKLPAYFKIMQSFGLAKAAQPGLNQYDLKNIIILVPSTELLSKFRDEITNILHLIFTNSFNSENLRLIREFLLPILINGQVTMIE